MKLRKTLLLLLGALAIIGAGLAAKYALQPDPFDTGSPLTASAAQDGQIALLPATLETQNLPLGWVHRTFWRVKPASYVLKNHDQRQSLQCTTHNSGSILARDMSLDLADFPMLNWHWKIETPLTSTIDEETRDGDDHPARFFLVFEGATGEKSAAEVIWSNTRFKPGDYKIINGFHHLVANGLNENVGKWFPQQVDLETLYQKVSGKSDPAELTLLGFFCDSDNTGGSTSAYFSDIFFSKRD